MANGITGFRIVCALTLAFVPTFSRGFYVLYLLGGISDALDGIVARRFGRVTELGSRLDTASDTVFTLTVWFKVVQAVYFPPWLLVWVSCIAAVKAVNILSGMLRYKRLMAEHTVANKLCGALLFALPLCIGRFPWQPVAVLLILSCAAATFAALQEGHLIRRGKEIQ